MEAEITSTANQKIKWVKSLHKNSTRREAGVFLVEGAKEISLALDGGYVPQSFFVCPEIAGEIEDAHNNEMHTVSKEVFEKISYRSGSDGLLAIFHAKQKKIDELNFGENPFILVVEAIEKPGNLGAIIRTADGAGADAVVVCDERTDIYNPNVIRSSVGTVFTKQVVAATSQEVSEFLEKHEITPYSAVLSSESELYTTVDMTRPLALVLGTEHEGLSSFWRGNTQPIAIPMNGSNDSLNVSGAAAILAYEVVRQRHEDS